MADIAGTTREGLLAMAVGAGLAVMQASMEDRWQRCAAPGQARPARRAARHGTEDGSATLGRRTGLRAVQLGRDGHGQGNGEAVDEALQPRFGAVGTTVEKAATSTSKSSVSRRSVEATETALGELLARDLSGLVVVALMVDGVHFADHLVVVAPRHWHRRHQAPLGRGRRLHRGGHAGYRFHGRPEGQGPRCDQAGPGRHRRLQGCP
jgi:putative transposase